MAPERTCTGCRVKRPKAELLRIARLPEGGVEVDEMAHKPGRGAYVCRQEACWQRAIKKRQIDRTLRVSLSAGVRQSLLDRLANGRGYTMGVIT